MATGRPGDFPASMAVLGLLVRQADTIGGLAARLEEEHPNARWPRNIVHNTLDSHVRHGYVRELHPGRGRGAFVYEATPDGVEHFRARLRESAAALPALRDALRAKVRYVEDEEGLVAAIRDVREQEELCVGEAEAARARYRKAWRLGRLQSSDEHDLGSRVERALMIDEVRLWRERANGLRRFRRHLEDPRGEDDTLEGGDRDG